MLLPRKLSHHATSDCFENLLHKHTNVFLMSSSFSSSSSSVLVVVHCHRRRCPHWQHPLPSSSGFVPVVVGRDRVANLHHPKSQQVHQIAAVVRLFVGTVPVAVGDSSGFHAPTLFFTLVSPIRTCILASVRFNTPVSSPTKRRANPSSLRPMLDRALFLGKSGAFFKYINAMVEGSKLEAPSISRTTSALETVRRFSTKKTKQALQHLKSKAGSKPSERELMSGTAPQASMLLEAMLRMCLNT